MQEAVITLHVKAGSNIDVCVDPAGDNDYFDGADFSLAITYKE